MNVKKKGNKKRKNIMPMKILQPIERNIFNEYRRRVEEVDEKLVLITLDKLEYLEAEYNSYRSYLLNEVIIYLNDEFTSLISSDKTPKEMIESYKEKIFVIKNLDNFYKERLEEIRNSINDFTEVNGSLNGSEIDSFKYIIENAHSNNLINHVSIYLSNFHNNSLLLLNYLIDDLFDNFKSESIEYLHKAEILLFANFSKMATNCKELKGLFDKIQNILNGNKDMRSLKKIVKQIDEMDLDKLTDADEFEEIVKIDEPSDTYKKFEIYQKEKHYDFKELEEIAINNNYKLVRVKGDHYIYKNVEKKHSIPIPCRHIGKGLSLAIKKELIKC